MSSGWLDVTAMQEYLRWLVFVSSIIAVWSSIYYGVRELATRWFTERSNKALDVAIKAMDELIESEGA